MQTRNHSQLLSDLIDQAQGLLENPPVTKEAYAAWRDKADEVLSQRYGSESSLARMVRARGLLPTTFHEPSMERVRARLNTERQQRLTSMLAVMRQVLEHEQAR